ncbi:MAG: hypothetical protein JWO36_5533 [Myxococcales bacterium]|nr:hypothetical protein [Myxococcales bacterium]
MKRITLAVACVVAMASVAGADNTLHVGAPVMDPPTLVALGVQLPITGDDNFTATVAMRYRKMGTTDWHDALPLVHVHAEAVTGLTVPTQFAGSIFDLAPDTAYEIELHAVDTDGAVDTTLAITAKTRAVPADPQSPHPVAVTDVATLSAALSVAQAGDVITLADGTYAGAFAINASGTAINPIVIRGTSRDGTILDGGNCTGCNVIDAYGSFVHIENLTIQHASRALRFQTAAAQANVVRHVHIKDVTLGIGSRQDQKDFYLADNLLEGRLVWPCVYTSDDPACNAGGAHGLHANDDGIHVEGTGHVIAHNTISGFGDAMKTEQDGVTSVDFYGNDVLSAYDNGLELDGSARNTRALRNRFTNTFATLSFQPIFGGPAYAIRNVLVNVADEQFKLHSRGGTPTVGAVIVHNTIVRGTRALQCSAAVAPMYFTVENNLFVGPTTLADTHVVSWDLPSVSTGQLDYNGYYPDGAFEYGYSPAGVTYPSFAALVAGGSFETHSTLVTAAALAGGLVGPADWHTTLTAVNPTLATGSPAIDRGIVLPNIDDGYQGAAPDLGALEAGCDAPIYGVRPAGLDESNESFACHSGNPGFSDAGVNGDGGTGSGTNPGGCCQTQGSAPDAGFCLIAFAAFATRRRRQLRAR